MKDVAPERFGSRLLGRGVIDIPGVLCALRDAGYDGWLTVELGQYDGAPTAAALGSFRYLTVVCRGVGDTVKPPASR